MSELWAVSSGSYSDYRVECVCSTEQIAEAVRDLRNAEEGWGECFVERLAFYDSIPERVRNYRASVRIDRETAKPTESIHITENNDLPHRVGYPFDDVTYTDRPQVKHRNAPAGYWVDVWGLDRDGVLKAMSDTIVQLTPEMTRRRR